MASIRRTLSPVPRPGTTLGGEATLVASPLSKSSSSAQNYPPTSTVWSLNSFSSLPYLVYRTQAFVLGIFSKRHSRPIERSKSKGQTWRKAIVHFFICFMLGVFIGLTSSASTTKVPLNVMSKYQDFSFELISPVGKAQIHDTIPKSETPSLDSWVIADNATLERHSIKRGLTNGLADDTLVDQPLNGDSDMVFHKLLIIVTATYARPTQAYFMSRLAGTLRLVPPPLLWIVVDMAEHSTETAAMLRKTGVMYRHLVCELNSTEIKDGSVRQRNLALSHIETHRLDGITYFADDDKIYSIDLFEQMRQISRLGTWMVAKVMDGEGEPDFEGPICNGTKVIGWHTSEANRNLRRFHVEMSGFAFNSTILWDPSRWHRPTLEPIRHLDSVNESRKVSTFIEQIMQDESQMECWPQDGSRIMVWDLHIQSSYAYPPEWFMKNNNNLNVITSLS